MSGRINTLRKAAKQKAQEESANKNSKVEEKVRDPVEMVNERKKPQQTKIIINELKQSRYSVRERELSTQSARRAAHENVKSVSRLSFE